MSDIFIGKKFNEKHLTQIQEKLSPHLVFGEVIVLVAHFISRKLGDTLVVTNKRVLITFRHNQELQFSLPLNEIKRVVIERSKLLIKTSTDEVIELGHISHLKEDEPVIRSTFGALASTGTDSGPREVGAMQTTADIQIGPRTKPKNLSSALSRVETFLEDGEFISYIESDGISVYAISNRRLLIVSGGFKTSGQEVRVDNLVRVEVNKHGTKYWLIGADANHEFVQIAQSLNENSMRWLAEKLEESFENFQDPWRDALRIFLANVGLDYAFEAIFPVMWPRQRSEDLLSAFGAGEDLIIFTSERAVVLPDLISINKSDWAELIFSVGRHEHYAFNGNLLQSQWGMSMDGRVSDGRRYSKLQYIGDSQQSYNQAIPTINQALQELASSGYPISEDVDWVEQTQNPPPQPSRGPTSFVGYSVEF